jgi:hypothetical protein
VADQSSDKSSVSAVGCNGSPKGNCYLRISAAGTTSTSGFNGVFRNDIMFNNAGACNQGSSRVIIKYRYKFDAVGTQNDSFNVSAVNADTGAKLAENIVTVAGGSIDWQEAVLDLGILAGGAQLKVLLTAAVKNEGGSTDPSVGLLGGNRVPVNYDCPAGEVWAPFPGTCFPANLVPSPWGSAPAG